MSPATGSSAIGAADTGDLMSGYLLYVEGLCCSAQAKRKRRIAAESFIGCFDDVDCRLT